MRLESEKKWEESLASALKNLDKPAYSQKEQEILRQKLIRKISDVRREHSFAHTESLAWYYVLIQKIREIGRETIPHASMQVLLREKLLMILPKRRTWQFVFNRIFSSKAWAVITLLLFISGVFLGFFRYPDQVKASPLTYLERFEGDVSILRDGQPIPAKAKFTLRDQDVILTLKDSSVTIHFLDDSVGRLAEESELYIERLFVNPTDATKTIVDLQLKQGRLWAKVLNLVDEFSHFQVKTGSTLAVAKKKAVFDVAMDAKGKTKVAAVRNLVDVTVAEKKKTLLDTTLANGYAVEVTNGKAKVTSNKEEVVSADEDSWVSGNLEADKVYVSEIVERDRETRRETADAGFNPVQAISNTTTLFKSDLEKEKAKLKAAEAKLVQAEVLIEQGHSDQADELIKDFDALSKEAAEKIKTFEKDDPETAFALKEAYENQLKIYKKQFAVFLPDNPVYRLKEAIDQSELNLAATPVEKTQKALDIASDKLLETQQALSETGKEDVAAESLKDFTNRVEEVTQEAAQTPDSQKKEVVSALLDKKADHLKLLQALAAEVELKAPPVLLPSEQRGIGLGEMLGNAAKASLSTEAVSNIPGEKPSEEVMQKIEEIKQVEVNGKPIVEVKNAAGNVILESPLADAATPAAPAVSAEISALPSAAETPAQEPLASLPEASAKPVATVQKLSDVLQEIKTDPLSGITVLTIEAKPSEETSEVQE